MEEILEQKKERVILVGVALGDSQEAEESLEELKELAETAGAEVAGSIIQAREQIHSGTYVGKGKIEEIRNLCLRQRQTALSATMSFRRLSLPICLRS